MIFVENSFVCNPDERLEVKELNVNVIGTYRKVTDKEILVGHLPIELSKLISFFIDIEHNHEHPIVNGKSMRETGLESMAVQYICFTSSKRHAITIDDKVLKRKKQYSCLSLVLAECVDSILVVCEFRMILTPLFKTRSLLEGSVN